MSMFSCRTGRISSPFMVMFPTVIISFLLGSNTCMWSMSNVSLITSFGEFVKLSDVCMRVGFLLPVGIRICLLVLSLDDHLMPI